MGIIRKREGNWKKMIAQRMLGVKDEKEEKEEKRDVKKKLNIAGKDMKRNGMT